MRTSGASLLTAISALLAVNALAGPSWDVPRFHRHLSRRALGAADSSPAENHPGTTPIHEDTQVEEKPSQAPVASGSNSSPLHFDDDNDGDTPAEDVLELLDELYGDSRGTGPSDDWRDQWEDQPQEEQQASQAPPVVNAGPHENVQSPTPTRSRKTVTVKETDIIWVTSIVRPAGKQVSSPPPSTPPKPHSAPPPPPPPPPPSSTPSPPSPPPAAATVAKPQPTPHEQPKSEQAQTVEKPQPTKKEPAGSSPKASGVSTDGLPLDFVENLDCSSPIYQGLSKLHHDIHRSNHSLPLLVWNDTLFGYAKETAETCVYGHSLVAGGGGYGQNIAAGDAPGNITAVLTNAYYNAEIELFFDAIGRQWGNDQPDMSNFEKWGHATQMLWKTTTSFACYTATCSPPGADPLDCAPDGTSYLKNVGCGNGGTKAYNTVCNYYPPGNYAGEYSSVPAPKGTYGFVEVTGNGIIGLH